MRFLALALVAVAGSVAHAEPSTPPAPPFAKKLEDARGVAYAAEVAPGLLRGGRPDAIGVAWLKARGVKTVLNLRHFHGDHEQRLVEAAGMTYRRVALESSDMPTPFQLATIMKVVLDPSLRPLYVHCKHGVDRTGTVMAIYRMEIDRWTNLQALAEMEYFGAHAVWRDLRAFVSRYKVSGLFTKKD